MNESARDLILSSAVSSLHNVRCHSIEEEKNHTLDMQTVTMATSISYHTTTQKIGLQPSEAVNSGEFNQESIKRHNVEKFERVVQHYCFGAEIIWQA